MNDLERVLNDIQVDTLRVSTFPPLPYKKKIMDLSFTNLGKHILFNSIEKNWLDDSLWLKHSLVITAMWLLYHNW